ncbi:hypothetical protein FRX31_027046 [Thalictrum thalictroides]|uniref:Uncharacterized protein n=1 Tax=Thalictrum thalictroides TaxID=46969 RepID=A0A7J6VF42_THATH|nr:hypothetical protein FRX31_027046 [Thalictrum thalictroides]
MSGAPKRLHEEAGSNEYHSIPFESGQDGQLAKVPRTESHDVDRRSPLHQMHQMPPPGSDSFVDHHVTSNNRLELEGDRHEKSYRCNDKDSRENEDIYIQPIV